MSTRFSYSRIKRAKTPPSRIIIRKHGGIIAGGVGHANRNNIGDYGIPVVPINSYMQNGGKYIADDKKVEVESEEIVFNKETSDKIDQLVDEYNGCGCSGKLQMLGSVILDAVKNLKDETCRTECKFEPKLKEIR